MQITFLGGADEVGASCILIEIAGRRLLVDAGIRPTPKARWGLEGDQLPDLSLIERSGGLDAILVTHAHTDHTGALELVVERYPDVPVYATPVTAELTRVLHQDARRIMQSRLEDEGELPLYDEVATAQLLAAFRPVTLRQPLNLAPGLTATFFHAGHIAGAAMIGLASSEGRVLISGDVSISPQRTVDGARPPAFSPDILILESTYGGRLHANRLVEERRLVERVAEVVAGGGKVLIPAFALGRAQELLLILGEFQRRGEMPPVPVWADGMVRAICQAYGSFPETLPLALQEQGAAFFTEQIRPVTSAAQRNALIWDSGAAVIVASSGMLAGGPSLAYARALAGQPQHAILLTGYQDEESPGRRLQAMAATGRGILRLGKDRVDVQCQLGTYSLSAHADTGQLTSLVETLNPAQVFLVHGDEAARQSMAETLRSRGRAVRLPRAGQSFAFAFTPLTHPPTVHGAGRGQRLDLHRLWETLERSAAGDEETGRLVADDELAQIWWGEKPGPTQRQRAELAAALTADPRYFAADPTRPGLYRIQRRSQVELGRRRQAQMAVHGDLTGRWVVTRDPGGDIHLAQVTATATDHLVVVFAVAGEQRLPEDAAAPDTSTVWPEEILTVLDDAASAATALAQLRTTLRSSGIPAAMEPNQAMALAQQRFPAEARLRRTGYRLAERVLVLTFDFPDVVKATYPGALAALANETGWQVDVTPEANHVALNALVGECLPAGWRIQKGPSIHRMERRVVVGVVAPEMPVAAQLADVEAQYAAQSGFALVCTVTTAHAAPLPTAPAVAGIPMEFNQAHTTIQQALAASGLYRTSLKEGEIVLSFISPQVGERQRETIAALAAQVGWLLRINPQPNQNAILDTARRLIQQQGWRISRGPSIYPERAEVAVTLFEATDHAAMTELQDAFAAVTGYRLVAGGAGAAPPCAAGPSPVLSPESKAVTISIANIRLSALHQGTALNPARLDKAIERIRRLGLVSPPIQVRRVRDGYLLLDGLYRLRAAQVLGHTQILADVL